MKKTLFAFILLCGLNCTFSPPDSFCEEKKGYDYTRIPLKKPYELMRLTGKENWALNYIGERKTLFPKSTINIVSANVIDNYVVFYSDDYTDSFYPPEKSFYGVIDVNKSKEYYFNTKMEFDSATNKLGLKEIKLLKVSEIWNNFNEKGRVNWCK